ncbi:MAG: acyl-CoA dehydrogenase family protein [Chloroflexota bacterium]|nr:acyl-CoA dehydrogenase family protein [Dehalococcoidia bacterium]MDW8252519.1 acyl-CoA dehydrogenase family protein [Chloroflexota bacterium]
MPSPLLNYLDWELTPEQGRVQRMVRQFVEDEALPLIPACFEAGRFPRELIPRLGALGLLGPTIPVAGPAADATTAGLICLELERGDSALRSFASVQGSLVMFPLWRYGSDEQRARYLPGLARGTLVGGFGLTEHEHGSDPAGMETRAERVGDEWVLNGVKMWVTNAPFADVLLIWAKVAEEGRDVVRGFLVEAGTPGVRVTEVRRKLSLRASATGEVVLEDCRLPAEAVLPGVRGMRGPLSCLTEARFGVAFGVVGAAMACYEAALSYARTRVQWGRPIAGFQLTQAKLVDALEGITQGQLLAFQLARLKEAGRLTPQQVSLAKRANCRMALEVARSMRSILAANGILLDYPVFRHLVNLETVFTYEGTHEIHTLILGADITGLEAYRG